MAGRHCRHVQRGHGGVGHIGGQCKSAAYCGEPVLDRRRSHLGPYLLHRCQCDHPADQRLAFELFGTQTIVNDGRDRVYAVQRSLWSGAQPSSSYFFRVLQGITGGGLQPLSQSVLLEEFPGPERGNAMAFWSLGIIAAPVLGPTLGGWITDNYSWRWVFFINLPIGIISLMMIYHFVYDPSYIKRGTMRFDAWGMGMLAIGMGALQIMLDKGQEDDWFGSRFITTLAITASVMLTAFVIRELRTAQPLVKLSLLRHRSFAVGIVITTVLGFVLYGSLVSLPLFMQELLGWTAETAGFWTSPRGIATAVCMPVVGYMLGKRWDPRWMVVFGCLIGSMAFFGYYQKGEPPALPGWQ